MIKLYVVVAHKAPHSGKRHPGPTIRGAVDFDLARVQERAESLRDITGRDGRTAYTVCELVPVAELAS